MLCSTALNMPIIFETSDTFSAALEVRGSPWSRPSTHHHALRPTGATAASAAPPLPCQPTRTAAAASRAGRRTARWWQRGARCRAVAPAPDGRARAAGRTQAERGGAREFAFQTGRTGRSRGSARRLFDERTAYVIRIDVS